MRGGTRAVDESGGNNATVVSQALGGCKDERGRRTKIERNLLSSLVDQGP